MAWRPIWRNSVSAASPRRRCSSGVMSGTSPHLPGRRLTVTIADLRSSRAAIITGAVERVRPKMMTVVAIMAGLLPILWSVGAGSEVMRRIAVPMVGGMLSSTFLTLLVIPAIYTFVKGRGLRAADQRVAGEVTHAAE